MNIVSCTWMKMYYYLVELTKSIIILQDPLRFFRSQMSKLEI